LFFVATSGRSALPALLPRLGLAALRIWTFPTLAGARLSPRGVVLSPAARLWCLSCVSPLKQDHWSAKQVDDGNASATRYGSGGQSCHSHPQM
jgi:hypothetical protein